jgi:uncharacterized protein YqgC (DUF456 family)
MEERVRPQLSLKQRTIAILLMVIGFLALVTPLTPGAWLGLVGLGMWLGKSPSETWIFLNVKWRKVWKKGE